MAKKKAAANTDTNERPTKKVPLSRNKVRYVAMPLHLYEMLSRYARERSDELDEKSIAWAARVVADKFFRDLGWLSREKAVDPPP